ncbi:hypothetical protein EVAR_68705_1 [Eumeta japonica]|uniref:Uncharacterized protein n=1 Tax=Eumeta variegata TaxID=151549 RepID=A0A4C1ZYX2_EUMVA|nr:hypothetical protein EVAR_68705_1 [Eumeta japonica]
MLDRPRACRLRAKDRSSLVTRSCKESLFSGIYVACPPRAPRPARYKLRRYAASRLRRVVFLTTFEKLNEVFVLERSSSSGFHGNKIRRRARRRHNGGAARVTPAADSALETMLEIRFQLISGLKRRRWRPLQIANTRVPLRIVVTACSVGERSVIETVSCVYYILTALAEYTGVYTQLGVSFPASDPRRTVYNNGGFLQDLIPIQQIQVS